MKNFCKQVLSIGLVALVIVFIIGSVILIRPVYAPADQYPGNAKMVAGQLWESFFPPHIKRSYSGWKKKNALVSLGNIDRAWSTPTGGQWPGGYNHWFDWAQVIVMYEYNPDPNFNLGVNAGDDKHYMPILYLDGQNTGGFTPYPQATDDDNALHTWMDDANSGMYYTARWPTNAGINVVMELRQFTLSKWHFDDFILVTLVLTNTGNVDSDGDGTFEKTGNRINALTIATASEVVNSTGYNTKKGRRGGSDWYGARRGGYDGTAGVTVQYPAAWTPANHDFGMNKHNQHRAYTEAWKGWTPVAVKEGAWFGTDAAGAATAPDKKTIYDSPPIGIDPATGVKDPNGPYFTVTNAQGGLEANPRVFHHTAMGVWFANGGRSKNAAACDYSPDPNYFASGATDDFLNFVPKAAGARARPQGDTKAYSDDPKTSAEGEPSGLVNPGGQGHGWEGYNIEPTWKDGYSGQFNFDGDLVMALGPFSLEVGESMTVVIAECAGFRLKGLRQAVAAARAAFANGYSVPKPPQAPLMKVRPTTDGKIEVLWKANAEDVRDPDTGVKDFAGYRIYKSRAFPPFNSLEDGLVWMEGGQVNPLFATKTNGEWTYATDYLAGWVRKQEGGQWGPYHLQLDIPAAEKNNYALSSADPEYANEYRYIWKDEALDVNLGFTYWYSVTAYDQGGSTWAGIIPDIEYNDNDFNATVDMTKTFTGSLPELESGHWNWNGRDGKWHGTFPEAYLHEEWTNAWGSGAPFVLTTPVASTAKQVGVKPNPYKKKALFDVGLEHKIMFYNLPDKSTIKIYDITGQLMDTIPFDEVDPMNGTVMWDMYSNDGIEIASGLYIYVVEYPGGKEINYFTILR